MIYSGHEGYLDDIKTTVRVTTEALKPFRERFQAIVVSGMSGALVGSPVAIRLRRQLVVVRKHLDDCHDGSDLINAVPAGTGYLFLDDFISLGKTFRRVKARMQAQDIQAVYVGSYLYAHQDLSWADGSSGLSAKLRSYSDYD